MVFEGVSEMVGDVGLRCANPTYAVCMCCCPCHSGKRKPAAAPAALPSA